MDKQHKAAKIISGLVLLASILLLIDYYLPQRQDVLIVDNINTTMQSEHYRGHTSHSYYNYWYAGGVEIAENNFTKINFLPGDTLVLTRSRIYKIQTAVMALSGYYAGVSNNAEYNPFAARGLFILLPILFAIGAIRSKDKGGSIVGCGVAIVVYLADTCSLFIL